MEKEEMTYNQFLDYIGALPEEGNLRKEYYKKVAERYPFLIPVNVWTGKIDEDFDFHYLEGFFGYGWEKIFLRYCEAIKPSFDKLLEEFREKAKKVN